MTNTCPECGAVWTNGVTCEEHFHQMLYWENENPVNGEVHHLTVLCYYLQHPSLYSPDGLANAIELLVDFVDRGLSPQTVREKNRDQVRSDKRTWKVTSRSGAVGAYPHPVQWTARAGDVTAAGEPNYRESVRRWAASVLAAIRQSNPF